MKLYPSQSLKEIKEIFSSEYPGLKLEFYSSSHGLKQLSSNEDKLAGNLAICSIPDCTRTESLVITSNMTVGQVEELFLSNFCLNVQIFRKSNDLWLQTSITDNWTLEKQNNTGLGIDTTETNCKGCTGNCKNAVKPNQAEKFIPLK